MARHCRADFASADRSPGWCRNRWYCLWHWWAVLGASGWILSALISQGAAAGRLVRGVRSWAPCWSASRPKSAPLSSRSHAARCLGWFGAGLAAISGNPKAGYCSDIGVLPGFIDTAQRTAVCGCDHRGLSTMYDLSCVQNFLVDHCSK